MMDRALASGVPPHEAATEMSSAKLASLAATV
jgi:hypothetical protein